MTMTSGWFWLWSAVAFNVLANAALKYSSQITKGADGSMVNKWFILALIFYGINFLSYFQAIKNIYLSIAYPIVVGLSALGVACLGLLIWGERLTFNQYIGIVFILIGVVFISRQS